jgi:hypothetical protein
MSTIRFVLAWLIALLTLAAYILGAVFVLQGFIPATYTNEHTFDTVFLAMAGTSVSACLLALITMNRGHAPEHPAFIRLPASRLAKWALSCTALCYISILLFTGNTLFDLMMAPGMPDEIFQAALRVIEGPGLWLIPISALSAVVTAMIALIRNRDRALVLSLPFLPAFLVFGFIAGELLVGHE